MGESKSMISKMLAAIGNAFPMEELSCGEFAKQKVSGMNFVIRCFYAEGLGNVSTMVASGFFGLMKMDTLIVTPTEKDMPLFSYDRINAMGNDTLIFELYDTMLNDTDLSALQIVKDRASHLPEHDLGTHWFDSMKLAVSLSKKGKKTDTATFNNCTLQYLDAFLAVSKCSANCEPAPKRKKASVYVEGLLAHGGPSTNVFKKGIGDEKTAQLFRKYLFATEV